MAVVNLAITIPDAQVPRVLAAFRDRFGAATTQAQMIEYMRQNAMQEIRTIVQLYEARLAAEAVTIITTT